MPSFSELGIRSRISIWNRLFPFDLFFRKKYGIPWGSKAHKESFFLSHVWEYLEHKEISKLQSQQGAANLDQAGEKISDEEFDEIDINSL